MISVAYSCLAAVALSSGLGQATTEPQPRWTEEQANAWYDARPWLVGCNFAPSTAGNQLEMWQADTFDPETIDRELGWAESLGFNTVRVFLHDIAWKQDPEGFLNRVDQFLAIAERHGIAPLIVFFDAVWDPFPKAGPQRQPTPHVHNSVWVQSPSLELLKDRSRHAELEPYVKAVLTRFGHDPRVLGWDLYNEPGNRNHASYGKHEPEDKAELSLALLQSVYAWAREVGPDQPLTIGVWEGSWDDPDKMSPLTRFMLEHSVVISFHSYRPVQDVKGPVDALKRYNRPILCTEYMARTTGSTFANLLPYFKDERIAAYNWGFVAGKTQTNYPWESWEKTFTAEPQLWFHDIFRTDGTPYDAAEVETIRALTGK